MNNTMALGMVAKLTSRNGGQSVWVSDVVEALNAEGYEVSLAEFKTWAMAAYLAREVTLRRNDMILMPGASTKSQASEIHGMAGSTFHTIEA